MRIALVDPGHSLWRNVLGAIAIVLIVPIAIVVKLIAMPFERPKKSSPEEVARSLRGFLEGLSDDGAWDACTHIPLADARLESIRERAAVLDVPLTEQGERELVELLAEAEALASER